MKYKVNVGIGATAPTETSTEQTTSGVVPLPQLPDNNLTNETTNQNITTNNNQGNFGEGQQTTTSTAQEQPEEQEDDEKIKLKIERLSKIRDEIKKGIITVKQAKEQLKAEQLKYVDIDEIESEEDAVYAAKPSKEKAVIQQVQKLDYMEKVNGSIILRLG